MTNEKMISDRIAAAEKKLATEKFKGEQELAILRSLPEGCPSNVTVYYSDLYGVTGNLTFKPESLGWAIANFPALNIVKSADGSTFTSFIADLPAIHKAYEKNNRVKGWTLAGKYLYKFTFLETIHSILGKIEWYTKLSDGRIACVKVELENPRQFISYENTTPNARKNENKVFRALLKNQSPGTTRMQYWGSIRGTGDVIAWHPDGLSPLEMFNW